MDYPLESLNALSHMKASSNIMTVLLYAKPNGNLNVPIGSFMVPDHNRDKLNLVQLMYIDTY